MKPQTPLLQELLKLAKTRAEKNASCTILSSSGEVISLYERGVKDLYRLLKEQPRILKGALIADKIVGKGAAALMILGMVNALYTEVISQPALEIMESSDIKVFYKLKVDNIINREATDICPIERRCLNLLTPEECLKEIEDFIQLKRHI